MTNNVLGHNCEWFQNLLANAGEKGFSITAAHEAGERMFCLEARPIEKGALKDLVFPGAPPDIGIAVAMRIPVFFCPSCGRDLSRLIAEHTKDFDELAILAPSLAVRPES